MSASNTLSNIFGYVQLAMAGVAIGEQTFAADSGASKQQKVLDLINNEAQVAGVAIPAVQKYAPSIINMIVAGFNIAGLFQHKSNVVVTPVAPAP